MNKLQSISSYRYFINLLALALVKMAGWIVIFALLVIFLFLFAQVFHKKETVTSIKAHDIPMEFFREGTRSIFLSSQVGAWAVGRNAEITFLPFGSKNDEAVDILLPSNNLVKYAESNSDGLLIYTEQGEIFYLLKTSLEPQPDVFKVFNPQGLEAIPVEIYSFSEVNGEKFLLAARGYEVIIQQLIRNTQGFELIKKSSVSLPFSLKTIKKVVYDHQHKIFWVLNDENILQAFGGNQNNINLPKEFGSLVVDFSVRSTDGSLLVNRDHQELSWWQMAKVKNIAGLEKQRIFELQNKAVEILIDQDGAGFWLLTEYDEQYYYLFNQAKPVVILPENIDATNFVGRPIAGKYFAINEKNQFLTINLGAVSSELSWRALWGGTYPVAEQLTWRPATEVIDAQRFSLIPLLLGTFKAAFYALLVALPLALSAAIYSAYFLSEKLRRLVKPSIELISSVPTVILGFIAFIWLAPLLEQYFFVILILFLMVPMTIFLIGFLFSQPYFEQWNLLIKIVTSVFIFSIVLCMVCFIASKLEPILFGDSFIAWLEQRGVNYQQANALVVGLVLGFAITPIIFTLAEEALHQVPRGISESAYALGATHWQCIKSAVLPAAASGIIAAVCLGFGRALGETMIVLMVSGNNALSNFNVLEGMRTISATLAIEVPEAAVGSNHYRVLMIAALLLFIITFGINLLAEGLKQRLRTKTYSLGSNE